MKKFILNFLREEDGPTAVEYAVMLAMILALCLIAVESIGSNSKAVFQDTADVLN